MESSADKISWWLFVGSTLVFVFSLGLAAGSLQVFHPVFDLAGQGLRDLGWTQSKFKYYLEVFDTDWRPIHHTDQAYDGLNFVTRIAGNKQLIAEIIDMKGNLVHRWNIDWFELWPEAQHVPEDIRPRSKPGTHIHGAVVMPNGDLVFNFEHLGLVRLDRLGEIVWRLPYQTHHSVHVHDDGNLWVGGQKRINIAEKQFPHRSPPFDASTILEVSPEGTILNEWFVEQLLRKNGRAGLLDMSEGKANVFMRQDIIHLNDVEPFPESMAEGFFKAGDVLVSLRNINTVFVFERDSEKIKFISTGQFVWQHDPDFIDGNSISVYDNNRMSFSADAACWSRIAVLTEGSTAVEVAFRGSEAAPFYSDIMGKHQWLPNGNMLITESMRGRAFEVNQNGDIVWQYVNFIADNVVGVVQEVTRLPLEYAYLFSNPNIGN